MSWDDTLAKLDDRAKDGKTASVLIEAGEELNQKLADAMDICRVQERTVKDLERQVESLKNPMRETSVSGPTVKHEYKPQHSEVADSYSGFREGRWRLDEMESALMHLRMAGGEDGTMIRVRAGNLSAAVSDTGVTPSGWSFDLPQEKKGLRHQVWATAPVMIPLLTILAVLGWIL